MLEVITMVDIFYFVTCCFEFCTGKLLFSVCTFPLLCKLWANTVHFNFPLNTSMLSNFGLIKICFCVLTVTIIFTFFDVRTVCFSYSLLFVPTNAQYIYIYWYIITYICRSTYKILIYSRVSFCDGTFCGDSLLGPSSSRTEHSDLWCITVAIQVSWL
jgi:hypothetical protein